MRRLNNILCVFLVSSFFLCESLSGQFHIVKYENTEKATGEENIYDQFLLFNQKELYYIMPYHKRYALYADLLKDKEYLNSHSYMISLKKNIDLTNSYYGLSFIPKPSSLEIFIDDVPKVEWKIVNETQTLLGYNCQKAVGSFRGRNYSVWFTKEIPFSFGPWKFGGLPGLILKAEDSEGLFAYSAVSISLNSNNPVVSKIERFYNENSKTAITFKKFVEMQNISFEKLRNEAMASLPSGVTLSSIPDVRENLQEKKFEWKK